MASVNKAIILGNVGKDPDIRYTADGAAIANFSVATSENWKDKAGNKQEKTEWHRISAFGKLAEIIGQYVKKGTQVYIEGRIQTRKWQDKDGSDRYTTEIVASELRMLGGKSEDREPEPAPKRAPTRNETTKAIQDMDDEIPFMQPFHGQLWRMV